MVGWYMYPPNAYLVFLGMLPKPLVVLPCLIVVVRHTISTQEPLRSLCCTDLATRSAPSFARGSVYCTHPLGSVCTRAPPFLRAFFTATSRSKLGDGGTPAGCSPSCGSRCCGCHSGGDLHLEKVGFQPGVCTSPHHLRSWIILYCAQAKKGKLYLHSFKSKYNTRSSFSCSSMCVTCNALQNDLYLSSYI